MNLAEKKRFVKKHFADVICVKSKGKYSIKWWIFPSKESYFNYNPHKLSECLAWSEFSANSAWSEAYFAIKNEESTNLEKLRERNKIKLEYCLLDDKRQKRFLIDEEIVDSIIVA